MSKTTIDNRKLKVLVITLGGDRQKHIEAMFDDPSMAEQFEKPTFSKGVASRYIRNKMNFFEVAYQAGLLPKAEWDAIREADEDKRYEGQPTERFFDCLEGVPITTEGRQGSADDLKLHYSVELWRKSKGLNRGRSVLACVFAHLIAMKTFVEGNFDVILEDNVRTDPKTCAKKIWESKLATEEWEAQSTENSKCHFRFLGWLGSVPNMEWILSTHIPKRKFERTNYGSDETTNTIAPLPLLDHLNEDMLSMSERNTKEMPTASLGTNDHEKDTRVSPHETQKHTTPGGNLLWGAYAYWISKEAYESLMDTLRNDVGALVWKGKRMRNYMVKPIDKILPRQTLSTFGPTSVQISSHPSFFRAPMLTSKIHTQWDPGFCVSTEYQLRTSNLSWSDLWLTETEREIVRHHKISGKWLTMKELELLRTEGTR